MRLDLEEKDVELILFNLENGLQEHKNLLAVEKVKMNSELPQLKERERCINEIQIQGGQIHHLTQLLIKICEEKRTQLTHEFTPKRTDYKYCETCKSFFDFWKYGDLESAGHAECKVRDVTDEVYMELLKDCKQSGCLTEC